MVRAYIFLFFLLGFQLEALPLQDILMADNAASLRSSIKKYEQKVFLNILCERQKQNKKPPTACYELGIFKDEWCLRLSFKDVQFLDFNFTFKTMPLSSACRKHLKHKQRLLSYRLKDFLLPELKKYWTDQEIFLYKEKDAHSSQFSDR